MKNRIVSWGVGLFGALLLATIATTGAQAATAGQTAPDEPPAPFTSYLPLAASGYRGSQFVETRRAG